ncbi:MAG: HigA family addiction module antitoxin [Anaerobiospirillum sp.]|nr:HigA family addiction module antitoxin [Anaerobiospirillum sp.]
MQMYDPPHPGVVLGDSFDEDFTVQDAASKMGVPIQTLTDIIDGKASITRESAFLIAAIFPGDDPKTWLDMQAEYDAWQVKHNRLWQQQMAKKYNLTPSFLDSLFTSMPA